MEKKSKRNNENHEKKKNEIKGKIMKGKEEKMK